MRERTEPSLKPDHKCLTKKTIMMKIKFAILFVGDLLMSFLLTTLKTSKKRSDARNTALDRKEKSFQWRKNGCCEGD